MVQLPEIPKTDRPLTEKNLMDVIADLCRFTMREVIHPQGDFFDKESLLATEAKYRPLIEWDKP